LIEKIYIRGAGLLALEPVFLGVTHLISGAAYFGSQRWHP